MHVCKRRAYVVCMCLICIQCEALLLLEALLLQKGFTLYACKRRALYLPVEAVRVGGASLLFPEEAVRVTPSDPQKKQKKTSAGILCSGQGMQGFANLLWRD